MTSEAPGIPCIQPGSDASNLVSSARFDEDTNENNVCVQTGEEFSTEFIRDRFARRVTVLPDGNKLQPTRVGFNLTPTRQLVCEDFTGTIGLRSSDVLDFVPRIGSSIEMENKAFSDGIRRCQWEYGNGQGLGKLSDEINSDAGTPVSISSPIYVVESVRSYHPFEPGARGAAAFSTKMKLLCSFGGKILPRPVDGKLRYVGGMTRIISVRKNSCWEELMKKTSAICNLPHIIKYQLPGEDLDALVSVCSDEDLHHMIEEYEDLERNGRCHRLRIFLVSLGETDSPNSFEAMAGQHSDPGSQYVAAVNATVDMSPQKGFGGQNLGSQTIQLGNTSDYSPIYHIHSPTSTRALENKDSVPISSNLAGMVSNTAAQFLSPLRIPNKSSYLSLSLSPSQVQHIDDQFFDGNESNSSCAMDKSLGGKPYYMNVNAYLNQLPLGSPPLMSYNHHQYLVETNQNNRPFKVNCHSHSPTRDLTPSPRGHGDISSERSGIKERAFRSELSLSHPEYPVGFLSGSNGEVGLQYKMVHALSDSQLHGLDDRSHHCLEEGIISQLYTVRENSPSQVNLNSSQEQRQCQEIVNVKHQSDKYENQCSPVTPLWHKEKHELGQNMSNFNDRRLEQGRNHSEGIIKTILSDAALKCNNFPNINYTANACIFPQDIQDNGVMTCSSPIICLEKPADNIREHPESYQLDTSEPELFLMSQRTTKKPLCSESEKIDDQPYSYGSPGLQAIACQGSADQESIVLNSKFHTSAGSGRGRFLHEKESLSNPDQKVEKVGPRKQSYRELKVENYVCVQSHPSDISDDRSPGITASSRIDPCVMDETSEGFSSPRETDAEIIPPESYNEDAKGDGKNLDGSINEASVADTEACIDGLQIINNSDLEELQELGSGTYGTVYHGKWRGTDVAIKRIKKSCFAGGSSEQERLTKDYWREARILSNLHHPNVVAFYGIVPEGPGVSLATVTEYMVNGSLRQVLQKKGRALDLRKRLILALDAAFGMEYLHLKNIVHFDLKCDNFLVNLRDPLRPICKVGDFGLSKIKHKTLVSGGVRGTLPWMAPELLNGGSSRVSEKVDVYSFGMALWEILTGDEPYANMHCGAIIGGIVNNTLRPPIPERCDPEWRKLMEECWSPDPAARPSFTDITIRLRSMLDALQTKRAHFSNR